MAFILFNFFYLWNQHGGFICFSQVRSTLVLNPDTFLKAVILFVAIIKSCWWNLIGNMGTARITYFGLVYACGVECGRITNLCQRYMCVVEYKRYQWVSFKLQSIALRQKCTANWIAVLCNFFACEWVTLLVSRVWWQGYTSMCCRTVSYSVDNICKCVL